MPEILKKVITPNDKTLRKVFSNPRAYHIDIYQREYKWKEDNVRTLLNDINVRFSQFDRDETDPKSIQQDVLNNFEPYFLNTFLTHTTAEAVSIVDGQQRLTTFLMMFIKFYLILKEIDESEGYAVETFAPATLEKLIFEANDFGEPERFKIHNENREDAFQALLEGKNTEPVDETQEKISKNFEIIDGYFNNYLKSSVDGQVYDVTKLTYYVSYILDKLSIVEIEIEKPRDVAMIFEVVNDRGLGLKPYEILKGKLIGNLENHQKEHANVVWTELQNQYFDSKIEYSTDGKIDLDTFFRTFFRAKFADSEAEYEKFEGRYHYEVYTNPKIRSYFGDFDDSDLLYRRVTEDIRSFAELYLELRTTYEYEDLVFNKMLDQNQQYLLIMSAITLGDECEEDKIRAISRKFDQFHVTLRLLDAYDSSSFQNFIYRLNKSLRNADIDQVLGEFDKELLGHLEREGLIESGRYSKIEEIFQYNRFQDIHNRWLNFSKYILMRVDRLLSNTLDKPSYAGADLRNLEVRFNKNNRKRYGMHLEHILANNNKNRVQFTDDEGFFDEQQFNRVRNRLGAVLLLKDRQNISSGNDTYELKHETYKKSNLIWNEILVDHLDSVDETHLSRHFVLTSIEPDENGLFPIKAVETRQRELFELIKYIWCENSRD